jgi:tRNA C32,U32 (ribose-2'-O)-methylase TrmJ
MSINLAQSVMLVAYELFMASNLSSPAPSISSRDRLFESAPVPEIEMMLARLEKSLVAIGFLAEDTSERIMFALRGMLGRSGVNRREMDIFNGIARQIGWFADGGREAIERKRRIGKKIR